MLLAVIEDDQREVVEVNGQTHALLSPLTAVQQRLLQLWELPPDLYEKVTQGFPKPPPNTSELQDDAVVLIFVSGTVQQSVGPPSGGLFRHFAAVPLGHPFSSAAIQALKSGSLVGGRTGLRTAVAELKSQAVPLVDRCRVTLV